MTPQQVNLAALYKTSRCFKDSVLWKWVDNLTPFAMQGNLEAQRRMQYIEKVLLKGRERPVERCARVVRESEIVSEARIFCV